MKIDHLAMYVADLEGAKNFFIKYFSAQANDLYHNPKTSLKTYFLTFDDGSRLEIMTRDDLENPEKSLTRTGYIHLAFALGSKEKVDNLTAKLKEDGYQILSGPRTTGDGYYESSVLGFEGNQIEITI